MNIRSTTSLVAIAGLLVVPGCGDGSGAGATRGDACTTPPAAGDHDLELVHDDIERTAVVHVGAGASTGRRAPVLIDFHGQAATIEDAHRHGFDALADRDGALVVYPQGVSQANGWLGWNAGPEGQPGGVDDVGFVTALLDEVEASYCADPTRVWLSGHSNGGAVAVASTCALGARVAAVAVVAAALSPDTTCTATEPPPLLEIHGSEDPVVSYDGDGRYAGIQEWLAGEATRRGCDTPARFEGERQVWSGCQTPLEHFMHVDGSHSYRPDDAELVWEFLERTSGR